MEAPTNVAKVKVCYVLSYRAPNYVRTASLTEALNSLSEVELTVIKNSSKGVLRYPQTFFRLLKFRFSNSADVYVLGFRAHESFWLFYPLLLGKKKIFDEFINYHDWFVNEHRKAGVASSIIAKTMDWYMGWVVKRCNYFLEDTPAHAELASRHYRLPSERFVSIPVGTEKLFSAITHKNSTRSMLEVFFYGSMLPLHGHEYILEAILLLNREAKLANLHFTIVGGKGKKQENDITGFIKQHNLSPYITYHPWVAYEELPKMMVAADVNLGGPFGDTGQGRRVVTGKTYQSLAMGVPTIIGRGENDGWFVDRQNALLAAQANPEELAATLVWCLEHKSELGRIGKQGQELYKEKFDTEPIAALLRPLLSKGGTAS